MKWTPFLLALALGAGFACRRDTSGWVNLDLADHGLPVTILAPDSAEVREKDYDIMRDITIRKGDDYFIQIFEFNVTVPDAAGEKLRQLHNVREDPYFKELLLEDDEGFIFSKQFDSTLIDYDFRYIKIVGEKELIFQTGLTGLFTLDEVKRMYHAVRG